MSVPISWREVYGPDHEERVWDGRGLSVNDATDPTVKVHCEGISWPERDKEAG